MEETNNTNKKIPRIRTFQSDIADALKEKQGSVIKIAVAENEKKQAERIEEGKQKKSNILYVFGGILLVILTGVVGFLLWQKNKSTTYINQNEPVKSTSPFITDVTKEIVVDEGSSIYEKINNITAGGEPVGTITKILFTTTDLNKQKSVISVNTLFEYLALRPPENVSRSIDPNIYFLGTYTEETTEKFLVFKTTAFANTFSGMLEWEKTMAEDFKILFNLGNIKEELSFKDTILKNKDTRILVDDTGVSYLSYAFFGSKKEFILITKKPETLITLIERLTEKKVRQ